MGLEVVCCYADASWWEWLRGSTLVFWRWGTNSSLALEGYAPFLLGDLPVFKGNTSTPSPEKRPLITDK
jgi:hypothetical protein